MVPILDAMAMTRFVVWQLIFHTYGPQTAILALTISCSLTGVVTFGILAGSMGIEVS